MPPTVRHLASVSLAFLMASGCAATASGERPPNTTPTRTAAQRDTSTVDHAQICVGQATRVRQEDQRCDDREPDHAWHYVPVTSTVPAVGAKVTTGIPYAPPRRAYRAARKGGLGTSVLIMDEEDRVMICVRARTRIRVRDDHCDDHLDGYEWYYLPMKRQVAAIGKKAERGTFTPPTYVETFRARRGGGKGDTAMVRPTTAPPETDEPRPTPTKKPTSRPTAKPTTRPTSKPTTTTSRRCRTVRSRVCS
ncbi:hypothetical protein GCM10009850_056850 [Nonomuraea monospora]|uniref:Lipoprotein n=1 Tax=Nonomuraea monospora TaxID=568818 RepID=A0ABN3CLS2_9ACTN